MSGRPRSLHLQLTLALVAVLGFTLCGFSLVMSAAFQRALLRQFDARLAEDAQAIADMVEERAQGPWQFEQGPLEDFESGRATGYFEVWMDDGSLLARSPSLASAELDRDGTTDLASRRQAGTPPRRLSSSTSR